MGSLLSTVPSAPIYDSLWNYTAFHYPTVPVRIGVIFNCIDTDKVFPTVCLLASVRDSRQVDFGIMASATLTTKLTKLLKIKHPIILAGMNQVST